MTLTSPATITETMTGMAACAASAVAAPTAAAITEHFQSN